ncbi:MAG TPA: molybdenum cofactor guanylyltransferase [Desulfotomaculum sp.]|nr:MAG: putative molybdenum cofactor guanylyltransferase [Desulfotomaculum sp. 46_80]KUK85374.1 MAG: putative molybdenum cofactor guanylyltransferase [Desulfofundulus kuznetsovii]HAG10630.1 molybdenum cofactor guanylyltransferase [Desulfotomaculum sp.]HBY03521.1 molybdenum cofactor guanylyltransferase [Desulfotomaculum sp.]
MRRRKWELSLQPVSAAVLAGGKSIRMGNNKALINIGINSLVEITINKIRPFFQEIILITNEAESYAHLKISMVPDIYKNCGPLGGIHAALKAASCEFVFVVACDMPFIEPKLVEHILKSGDQSSDIVIPRINNYSEPLHALYRKSCLPVIESSLNKGELKAASIWPYLRVKFIDREEINRFADSKVFFNINTPMDLNKAKKILGV